MSVRPAGDGAGKVFNEPGADAVGERRDGAAPADAAAGQAAAAPPARTTVRARSGGYAASLFQSKIASAAGAACTPGAGGTAVAQGGTAKAIEALDGDLRMQTISALASKVKYALHKDGDVLCHEARRDTEKPLAWDLVYNPFRRGWTGMNRTIGTFELRGEKLHFTSKPDAKRNEKPFEKSVDVAPLAGKDRASVQAYIDRFGEGVAALTAAYLNPDAGKAAP